MYIRTVRTYLLISFILTKLKINFRCKSVSFNPYTGECRLCRFNEKEGRTLYHPEFNFYTAVMRREKLNTAAAAIDKGGRYYYENYQGPSSSSISQSNFHFPTIPNITPRFPSSSEVTTPRFPGPEVDAAGRRSEIRCDRSRDHFTLLRSRIRLRPQYIKGHETVASLLECETLCLQEKRFQCLSFNYIQRGSPSVPINCELSEEYHRQLDFSDANHFEISEDHDYYARDHTSNIVGSDPCIDVTQDCTPDEMIFTLRTHQGFRGRIYTYKHFDRPPCYVRGNGAQVHTLRIPRANAFPNCGTEVYDLTQTNIVVVQHSELVQTSKDMIYNLTCTIQPPDESIVSSGYIGAG